MKKVSISLTSSMLLAAALASVAVATEGGYRNNTVPSQGPSLDGEARHALRASPAAEIKHLELAKLRKQTRRDDRRIGDE